MCTSNCVTKIVAKKRIIFFLIKMLMFDEMTLNIVRLEFKTYVRQMQLMEYTQLQVDIKNC